MKKKTKAIMQILLMLVMAVLFAFVPISYMQQVIRTNLATVEPSQLEQYEKKSVQAAHKGYGYKRRNGGSFGSKKKEKSEAKPQTTGEQLSFGGL